MKNRLYLKSIGCVFLLSPNLLAAKKNTYTIWVKAPQTSEATFKAHLKTLGPSHISYAKYKLVQQRDLARSFQLKEKLLSAQEFYLSGQGRKALQAFKEITDQTFLADWSKEDRRILLYSFLRQAQSEEDLEKRKALLLSASRVSLSGLKASDQDIFPPPLVEELKQMQAKAYKLRIIWKNVFPDHEIILINGEQMPDTVKISQGFYRVSAFSSSYEPWSKDLSLSELLQRKVRTKKLTQGTCRNLKIKPEEIRDNIQLLPVSSCPKPLGLKFAERPSSEEKESFKFPYVISKDLDSSLLNSGAFPDNFEKPKGKKQFKDSKIPSWLIVSAGVLTVFVMVSLSHQNQKKIPYPQGDYIY